MLMSVKDVSHSNFYFYKGKTTWKSQQFSPAEWNMKDCLAFEIMTLLLNLSAR